MALVAERVRIAPRVPTDEAELGFAPPSLRYQEQEQTQWCWATCAAMAGEHAKNSVFRQCNFASALYKLKCCDAALPDGCNRPCKVSDVSDVYKSIGLRSVYSAGVLDFAAIDAETKAGRPIEVGIQWVGGSGHVLMIVAGSIKNGKEFVELLDPWPSVKGGKTGSSLLSDLVAGFGRGAWKWVWTGIRADGQV